MANIKLTIQHGTTIYEPPVEEGVQIEWERTGSPGKLTFTTFKVEDLSFQEGDPVCFYYDDKLVFQGFVFTKKRDKEHQIKVTCYDQIRYLKNKFTYVFENKTATQIIQALCNDFNLKVGSMDNTKYVISAIAEENKAALDIILTVLEHTLLNTGDMFVFYDDAGKLTVKNCADMISTTLICEETAENFDYSSSIDDETYNSVVLYYSDKDRGTQMYTASSPTTINKWGNLRYFEKVDTPTSGQSKANALLRLFNKKTRELKVTGAFGDISVRGGTLIPTKLNLGDIVTDNYLLVQKVTHKFNDNEHIMDLTLEGAWEDYESNIVSKTIGTLKDKPVPGNPGNPDSSDSSKDVETTDIESFGGFIGNMPYTTLTIHCNGIDAYVGWMKISYTYNGRVKCQQFDTATSVGPLLVDKGSQVDFVAHPNEDGKGNGAVMVSNVSESWTKCKWDKLYGAKNRYCYLSCDNADKPLEVTVKWVPSSIGIGAGDSILDAI